MSTRLVPFVALTLVALCTLAGRSLPAQDDTLLRYDWQAAQSFAYRVKIVVDLPDKTETYQGTIHYTVKSVENDTRLVTFRGGLPKSTKSKATSRPGGFGPFRGRISPPPSPFSRSNFRGSEQTTNEITITSTGGVTSLKGDSQLPYLIGNISLLPFEPLPETPRQQWSVDGGVSITEKDERSDLRPHFGPFDPFGRGQREEEIQAASETTSYSVTDVKKGVISVAKSYELKSPAPKQGEAGFTFTGDGTWKFNCKLNISDSLHMDQKLVVTTGNQQVTVPITVDYQRLTDGELAEIQAAREKAEAELRRKAEEMAQAAAEKKRQAEAPLTAEQKQAAMTALSSADSAVVEESLAELAKKTPKDPDTEIAAAIEALLQHSDRQVRVAAHKALLQWSLEYRPRGALDGKYKGPGGSLDSTARVVTADTPLYVGQIVQLKDHWRWVPADILELYDDGKVKVHPRGWSTTAWDKAVSRESLQLAPDELFQPYKSPIAPAPTNKFVMRTWSDVTGTHKIEATYLGFADGRVQLKREDGREINVPLESLSQEDQQYVQQAQEAAKNPPNPFQTAPSPFE